MGRKNQRLLRREVMISIIDGDRVGKGGMLKATTTTSPLAAWQMVEVRGGWREGG
jgi:hypothetical protein